MKKILTFSFLPLFFLSCTKPSLVSDDKKVVIQKTNNVLTNESDLASEINIHSLINKLSNESIINSEKDYVFPVYQIKKPKVNNSSLSINSGLINLKGQILYPDEKNRFKPGANIRVDIRNEDSRISFVYTDDNGNWSANVKKSELLNKNINLTFRFSNKHWYIKARSKGYLWQGPEVKNISNNYDFGVVSPKPNTENAKVSIINDIYNRYLFFFKKNNISVDWWKKSLQTRWPMDKNYYGYNSKIVNMTHAEKWDVNAHEIGHAIIDIGTNSLTKGGFHKIDECYANNLSWSEGSASFLGAVTNLDRLDKDAKFEFLVPRRSPVTIEHVPDDVCEGQGNEWRVTSALWDLYDLNIDGNDNSSIPFSLIWSAMNNSEVPIGSIDDLYNSFKLISNQDQLKKIKQILSYNTMKIRD